MDINNLSFNYDDTYSSEPFLKTIEDHLTYLRVTGNINIVQLTNVQCVKYQGDFFGLLNDLKVDPKYHQVVLRVNNYFSPGDFLGEISQIIFPDFTEVDKLKNLLQTSNSF